MLLCWRTRASGLTISYIEDGLWISNGENAKVLDIDRGMEVCCAFSGRRAENQDRDVSYGMVEGRVKSLRRDAKCF